MKTLSTISPDNKLATILDFDKCRELVEKAKERQANENVILCPHYSINISMEYNKPEIDPEQLDWDLDELQDYIGEMIEVSDYDDLIVNLVDTYHYERLDNL